MLVDVLETGKELWPIMLLLTVLVTVDAVNTLMPIMLLAPVDELAAVML